MPRFRVYEIATAAYLVGEYEADSMIQAEQMATNDPQNEQPFLCHQCAGEVEIGDWYKFQTDEL